MALKLVDVKVARKRTLGIYGPNGAGKTHLAMTAPGKKLLIDYYGNIETCLKFPRAEYDVVEGPDKYSGLVTLLKDNELANYDTVILDNITGTNRVFVVEAKGSGQTGSHIGENPNMADYGLASERLRLIVTQMAELAKKGQNHVIMLAHERLEKDENDRLVGNPSVPGQVPAHIVSMFQELLYVNIDGNGDHMVWLEKHSSFPAATRILDPKKKWKNPTLKEMYSGYWD